MEQWIDRNTFNIFVFVTGQKFLLGKGRAKWVCFLNLGNLSARMHAGKVSTYEELVTLGAQIMTWLVGCNQIRWGLLWQNHWLYGFMHVISSPFPFCSLYKVGMVTSVWFISLSCWEKELNEIMAETCFVNPLLLTKMLLLYW